ncbi:MAG: SMC family ATPase [Cyanobacteria bacterium P01_F01_bin.53]
MQILSVTLTNFKTHKEKQFDFQLGTNAICGENGAGKTSILEAIAWVLFNYQGNYKKEDLVRNGASSAQARVAFISSRDSRTYEVQRSTSQGYIIFDPQLNERLPYTRTKDEVLPWLRQHLGVSPNTDLSQLFANTIGVPQGTFTVDFLLPTEKRKPIFDTVLKVEEYRETYKQSNSLRKYSEAQSQRLKDLIAQYEESLESWDTLQASHQTLKSEITTGEGQLRGLEKQSKALEKQRQKAKEQADKLNALTQQKHALTEKIEAQKQAKKRIESTLASAQKASKICESQKPAYTHFLAAEAAIKALNESRQERQLQLQQQQKIQQTLAQSQQNLARLEAQLEQFSNAEKELAELASHITTQTQLEAQQKSLQDTVQQFKTLRFKQKSLDEQNQRITTELAQTEAELKRLNKLKTTSNDIPQLEEQQNRIQQQLSRVEAAQQFEQELRGLAETGKARQDAYREQVVAALDELEGWISSDMGVNQEAITPIKDALFQGGILSKELLANLNNILSDLGTQVNRQQLNQQRKEIQAQLQKAYANKAEVMGIDSKQTQQKQLKDQQEQVKIDLTKVLQQLTTEAKTSEALTDIENQLKALDNPKGKQQLLQKALQQQVSVKQQHATELDSQTETIKAEAELAIQLKSFAELDEQMQAQQIVKQTHQEGYLQYLQNQQAAQQIETAESEAKDSAAKLTQLEKQNIDLEKQIETLSKAFDPEAFARIDKEFSSVNSQADQLRGSLPQQHQRLAELTTRIDALKATAEKRDAAQLDLKERDRIKRFVNYARKVYKTAGPRITERYVHNISREADRLFRELIGRQNVALTWSADYEITVQEGEHKHRFINLSGGEQMCAALAVRLALLKVLADIDVAFFDEPTTNMDRPRRASLAEAIARIKSFNQIFVISHDDTFEQVTDSIIQVTREA